MTRSMTMLAAVATLGFSGAYAAPVEFSGTPELTIYWQNNIGGPQRVVDTVELQVDDQGNFYIENQTFEWSWTNPATGQLETDFISLGYASGNIDPVINFAVGFVDNGSPSNFSIGFGSPLAPPIVGPANYRLDLAGSFSDGANDGGSLGAGGGTFGIMDGLLNASEFDGIGSPIGSFTAGGVTPFSFTTVTGVFDCGAGCATFGTNLSFLGSGGDDAYSFTGRFEITPIPVPTAVWLLGSAIGLLGFLRRRAI